jgi:hypothetical protein
VEVVMPSAEFGANVCDGAMPDGQVVYICRKSVGGE